MPLNSNISLSFRPPQIDDPNTALAKYMTAQNLQQQNMLSRYAMQKAQRADEEANALAAAYQQPGVVGPGGVNSNALLQSLSQGRAAGQIPAVQKSLLESQEKQAKISKEQIETAIKSMEYHRNALVTVNDPMAYAAWRQSIVSSDPRLAQMIPEQFSPQAKAQLLQTADQMTDRLFAKLVEVDQGGAKQFRNPYTGEAVGAPIAKTMTPGEQATDARARAAQAQAERHFQETSKREQFSQPFDVQGPDGTNILVQQDKRTGQLIDVNTKQPIGGVAPKMSAEAQTSLREVDKLKTTLDRMIKTYKPEYVGAKGMAGEFSDQYLSQAPLVGGAFGDKERVNFRQNASTVVNDYIKAITGATVGQSGEQQRLMRAVPAPNDSDIVFKAKMDEMRKNLDELPNIIAGKKSKGGGKDGFGPLQRVD